MLYAHSSDSPTANWHLLRNHLEDVAALAEAFASPFGAGDWARACGYLHDLGKASDAFQARLLGKAGKVDHSTAGGRHAFALFGSDELRASLLAYPVMGHHGGLPDGGGSRLDAGSLQERLVRGIPDYEPGISLLPEFSLPPLPSQIADAPEEEVGFATAFFIRMLFSCLTDADWLDTEAFCSPDVYARRPQGPSMQELLEEFNSFVAGFSVDGSSIQTLRHQIQQYCREAATIKPGCFSLTVPTGGGKTLSSLAFALEHALAFGKKRIIYVIPFTSIIEQNAAVFRAALGNLGPAAVLEHHSAYAQSGSSLDQEEAELPIGQLTDLRLATQNWDAPIIVTTAVQFFQSLYGHRPSVCRKLHNLADAVVILDEAQMLPPNLLNPCVMAIRELIRGYGASVVLCTATQPALNATDNLDAGFAAEDIREIIPQTRIPEIFQAFKRVEIKQAGVLSDEALAQRLCEQDQALCIVNTRQRARDLFAALGSSEGHFHLSALMYPAHRRRKLAEIKSRLDQGLVCRVISTSLIEAGVDIDFPAVFREIGGLDSIAQAAGRCNREGKLGKSGIVSVFTPEAKLPKAPFFQRRAAACSWVAERYEDLLSPQAVSAYFHRLYQHENLDGPGILDLHDVLDDDLEELPTIPFREIDRKFTFIDDQSVSLIVEQGEALLLLKQLESESDREAIRRILGMLQSYTVNVYPNALARLAVRTMDRFGLTILSGGTGYCEERGLLLDAPSFRENEHNIF